MVSIIKNQLLKHLSRYTKNLSSDKINISTFRGEGELSNLQLDEDVLNDLLELPGWLRLTSAWCNHVSFRISWTKLKSVPITMVLDEVNVTLETCELDASGRRFGGSAPGGGPTPPPPGAGGKYSFIHKIVDGITIVVNTVNVKFHSPAFQASVQMSRIRVESKTPRWLSGDLRVTRLKDDTHEQLLIFKELSWQTVRIEASSSLDPALTPLRLLTNQARCRITIKKRVSDCSIVSSRLVLILDDLLWVLTDSQLKAALHFVDSLAALIKRSTQLTQKVKAQKKLATMLPSAQQQHKQSRPTSAASATSSAAEVSATQKTFNMFDVHETSYHFFSQRIDLHLCDDAGEGRSCYPDLRDGGALQISVQGFQVDYYPFHLALSGRSHWPKYKESTLAPALWLEQSLNAFRESLLYLGQPPNERIANQSVHAPLERSHNHQLHQQQQPSSPASSMSPPPPPPQSSASSTSSSNAGDSPYRRRCRDNLSKLMTACVIVRLEDFTLYRVTTSGKKQMPKEFVSCDKDRYSFPGDLSTIHAEFTYFYYPGDSSFPLPPNKMFVHVNPVQIHFHIDSCLWFNAFLLNLHESLLRNSSLMAADIATTNGVGTAAPAAAPEPSFMYMDVKFEAIMPRIVFECPADAPSAAHTQRDRPKAMQLQISRVLCTNIRELGATRADLAQALHSLQEGSLVFGSNFPARPGDRCVVTDRILSHVAATDVSTTSATTTPMATSPLTAMPSETLAAGDLPGRYAFCAEPRDVWCMKLDPLWIDFLGARSVGQSKSVPFIDAVPITLWLHAGRTSSDDNIGVGIGGVSHVEDDSLADLHVIAHIANMVSAQIDHYQYLFLLRLAEELTELSTFVSLDADRIRPPPEDGVEKSIVFGCVVPQLEVTLVMPSQTPGKESSGCDAESVVPDSVSIGADDVTMAGLVGAALQQQQQQSTMCNGDVAVQQHHNTASTTYATDIFDTNATAMHASATSDGGAVDGPLAGCSRMSASFVSPTKATAPMPTATPAINVMNTSTTSTTQRAGRASTARQSVTSETFGSSLLGMKKGFSNFMTSIDSALKSSTGGASTLGADDASDSFSIRSDVSSDSENFALVLAAEGGERPTDCMDAMFSLNPFGSVDQTNAVMKASAIEVASEVCEEEDAAHLSTNLSSPSEPPSEANSWRRRDLVSMVTFRLTTVEVIHQTIGSTSSMRLQLSALACDECGAIPWDELQTKFGARCRAWNIAPYNPESPPCVQLRMDERRQVPADVAAAVASAVAANRTHIIDNKKTVLDWFESHVQIRVNDLQLGLSMSTVIGLLDLIEDEIIGKPLPADITLQNVRLHLVEDRPPVNVTSPGSVPIDLHIGRMCVKRDASGVVVLQPLSAEPDSAEDDDSNETWATNRNGQSASFNGGRQTSCDGVASRDREVLTLQLVMQQLKLDNEQLKWQQRVSDKSAESMLHASMQETELLKNCLNKAQLDISQLLGEKQTLLNTVRSLQKQLLAVGGSADSATTSPSTPSRANDAFGHR